MRASLAADALLGIPPDLDRALARTVLEEVRSAPGAAAFATDGPAADASAEGAPVEEAPAAFAAALTRVVDALAAQGARGSEVLLAVEDALAALMAGQGDPARRARLRALDVHARQLVAARLGYAR